MIQAKKLEEMSKEELIKVVLDTQETAYRFASALAEMRQEFVKAVFNYENAFRNSQENGHARVIAPH